MSWLDALAGGLTGVNQGLGQVQDLRQTQLKNKQQEVQQQLQQAQFKMQQDAQRREAVQAARAQLRGGMDVDPQQLRQFTEFGLQSGIEKTPDGKFKVAKTPQEQAIDLKFAEDQEAADVRRRKTAYLSEIHNEGSGYFQRDIKQRQVEAMEFGLKPEEYMLPDEQLRFDPRIKVAQIGASQRNQDTPLGHQRFQLQQQQANQQAEAAKIKERNDYAVAAASIGGMLDPKKFAAALQQYDQLIGSQSQPQSQPTQPTRRAVLGGKYQVEY